ncbi:MAG: CapA family protein, partial [Chloroflexota bacterium]
MPPRQPPRRPPMARPLSGSVTPHGASRAATSAGGGRSPGSGVPRVPGSRGGRGPQLPATGITVTLLAVVGVALLVGAAIFAGASPGASTSPDPNASPGPSGAPVASASAEASSEPGQVGPSPSSPAASAEPSTTPAGPTELPLALVADVTDLRKAVSLATLRKELAAGRVAVPCGLDEITLDAAPVTHDAGACVDAAKIAKAVRARAPRLGLLPAALVTPQVKVLQVGGADLFGSPAIRARPYPLVATVDAPPASWVGFDVADVRTLISTGDTCPDRGVSHQTNTLKKGWDWALGGGTAKYTGTHMDRRFDGPDGNGWPVVDAVRSGNEGAVKELISDAEITLNDFECPMTSAFRQHDTGTIFSIDPKVAPFLARNGIDVVTLASNHITDQGVGALKETLALFKKSGIKTFGAGLNLAEAMKPAVFDVRGVRFAFVGFNEVPGSTRASATVAGVTWLTEANVRKSIAAARKVADVVIVVPQWWPEYRASFTPRMKSQMRLFFDAGADQVIGHGTHWAAATSITKDDRGFHFAIASHGNFLFGQDWSRQTQ